MKASDPETLLLKFLRSAQQFGNRAGRIDEQYCRNVLGINHPKGVIARLQGAGHPVEAFDDGSFCLVNKEAVL